MAVHRKLAPETIVYGQNTKAYSRFHVMRIVGHQSFLKCCYMEDSYNRQGCLDGNFSFQYTWFLSPVVSRSLSFSTNVTPVKLPANEEEKIPYWRTSPHLSKRLLLPKKFKKLKNKNQINKSLWQFKYCFSGLLSWQRRSFRQLHAWECKLPWLAHAQS